jgi:hypothetical protein
VSPDPRKRVRLNIALYVVVLLVACACVVGGVVTWRTKSVRADAAADQERYGDVLASARAEAEAFINIRYDDAQESIDDVVAGATGFRLPEGVYETLAGLVLTRLGRIPEVGVEVRIDGWRVTVMLMDRHRIAELRLSRVVDGLPEVPA